MQGRLQACSVGTLCWNHPTPCANPSLPQVAHKARQMAELNSQEAALRQQRLRFTPTHIRNPLRQRETARFERHTRNGRKRTLSPELQYEGDAEMSEVESSPLRSSQKPDPSPWAQLSAIGGGIASGNVSFSPLRPAFSFSQRKKQRTDAMFGIPLQREDPFVAKGPSLPQVGSMFDKEGILLRDDLSSRLLSPSPSSLGLKSCPAKRRDAPHRQTSLETHEAASAPASPCGMSWMPAGLGELNINEVTMYSECV